MAFERQWLAVSATFTANGTSQGFLTVADATGFYVKQFVLLTSTIQQNKLFKVQRVIGPGTIYLGFPEDPIDKYRDLSAYLVADNAIITANQQEIRPIKPEDIMNAIYAREPIVAIRTIGVDQFGTPFDNDNPVPVSFTSAFPNVVKITDGGGSGADLAVESDGSINVNINPSTTPVVANPAIVLANTEYSYAFPSLTKQFTIKDQGGNGITRIAYAPGGTNTAYNTIGFGAVLEVTNVLTNPGFTVYFQSNKPSRVLEIVSWS